MVSSIFGWCGKILKIDLSNSRITELETMDYADRFLEGRGIATRIYWDSVGSEVMYSIKKENNRNEYH